jgi:hypothetical protein
MGVFTVTIYLDCGTNIQNLIPGTRESPSSLRMELASESSFSDIRERHRDLSVN